MNFTRSYRANVYSLSFPTIYKAKGLYIFRYRLKIILIKLPWTNLTPCLTILNTVVLYHKIIEKGWWCRMMILFDKCNWRQIIILFDKSRWRQIIISFDKGRELYVMVLKTSEPFWRECLSEMLLRYILLSTDLP